jgi:alkanesulfonate monooxygenase SsuD/methylene tetrahydromethanopterin reductase-like flavin-dependent oxidoreductase (luciferase family)
LSAKATLGPDATTRLARLSEELGYRSWWAGEHVVLPSPRTADSPMAPEDPILDPLIHLGYVAAVTETMELGTGIVILTDEHIDAMRALWSDAAPVAYSGTHVAFRNVDAQPRPVQPGGPRLAIGGHSPGAFRRAVARGHQWIGNATNPDDLVAHLRGLAEAAAQVPRPPRLGRLEITVLQVNPVSIDAEAADRYRDLGVNRLLVYPLPLEDVDDVARFLDDHARRLLR